MKSLISVPRKTILLIVPSGLHSARAGAEMVVIEMINVLQSRYNLTVLTFEDVDWKRLETLLGPNIMTEFLHTKATIGQTALVKLFSFFYRMFPDRVPSPYSIRCYILNWKARKLDRINDYDALLCNHAEWDFGARRRGITYAHQIPSRDRLNRKEKQGLSRIINRLIGFFVPVSEDRMYKNHILANSHWTADGIQRLQAQTPAVVYPPVRKVKISCKSKCRLSFIAAGRVIPEKRWEDAVEIIRNLRERGHDATLELLLLSDWSRHIERELLKQADACEWLKVYIDVERDKYEERLSRSEFFIHTMIGESFGIVVAEAIRAGCLCFAHDSGGPAEILKDNRLLFNDNASAVEKIDRVLNDSELKAGLLDHTRTLAQCFSVERFHNDLLEQVETFMMTQHRLCSR